MERNKQGNKSIVVDLAKEIAKNFLMGFSSARSWRLGRPRTATHYSDNDEFLKNYAFFGVNLLHQYLGDLKGKSVCEIGAGDYLTSGLSILAAGAKDYAVIDRFPGEYESEQAKFWYQQIEENWSRFYPELSWDKSLDAANFPEKNMDRLTIISESLETAQTEKKFDVVCSFQVGEHITDIQSFAEVHNRILKPDGVGLHRVDYGPHGCWFSYKEPLTFLRIPEFAWKISGSNRGAPNRRRHHEFLEVFEKANLNVEIVQESLFDEKAINFNELPERFQAMPKNSLLIGDAVYRLTLKNSKVSSQEPLTQKALFMNS